MEEEVSLIIEDAKERMEASIERLKKELTKLRAGKASPQMLESVAVDYYGSRTPLSQVANVNTPDPRTIVIQPWEKTMIEPIEKAILNSNLGFNPMNDGSLIRIMVPALTEERRKDLVKQVRAEGENAKVSIRNIRRDSNDEFKKLKNDGLAEDAQKDAEASIQDIVNSYTAKIDAVVKAKEEDITTI